MWISHRFEEGHLLHSAEVTQRLQTAIPAVRQLLLHYLLPWLYNMELVDANLPAPRDCLGNLFTDYLKPPLQGEGWGSPEATEMVLNNLFYITAQVCSYGSEMVPFSTGTHFNWKCTACVWRAPMAECSHCVFCLQFGDDHAKEIEDLWAALVTFWPNNLQVIVRYIVILSGMAPQVILPHVSGQLVLWSNSLSKLGSVLLP